MTLLSEDNEVVCKIETGDTDDFRDCECRLCRELFLEIAAEQQAADACLDETCPACGVELFPPLRPNEPWRGPQVTSFQGVLTCRCGLVLSDLLDNPYEEV